MASFACPPTPQCSHNSKDCSQDVGQVCRVGTVESGECKAGGGPDRHCSVGFRDAQTGDKSTQHLGYSAVSNAEQVGVPGC